MYWRRLSLLMGFAFFCTMANSDENIPVVEDVVAVASANPTKAVVYWKPLSDDRIAMYVVYYKSNASGRSELRKDVINLANSVAVDSLEIGHHYTFTVSVGYMVNGTINYGPRSQVTANSNFTTGLTLNDEPQSEGDDTTGVVALVFYGVLLVLSMIVNIVLLVMSCYLLKQLRARYRLEGSNTSLNNELELKSVKTRRSHDADIPRKPAREHSPNEAINEFYDGKCSPAKEAEVEVL